MRLHIDSRGSRTKISQPDEEGFLTIEGDVHVNYSSVDADEFTVRIDGEACLQTCGDNVNIAAVDVGAVIEEFISPRGTQ